MDQFAPMQIGDPFAQAINSAESEKTIVKVEDKDPGRVKTAI